MADGAMVDGAMVEGAMVDGAMDFVAYVGLVGMAEVAPTMFDGALSMERWRCSAMAGMIASSPTAAIPGTWTSQRASAMVAMMVSSPTAAIPGTWTPQSASTLVDGRWSMAGGVR